MAENQAGLTADAGILKSVLQSASPFVDKEIHPLILIELLNREIGPDWVIFLPETIRQIIRSKHSVEPADIVMDKIGALKTLLNSTIYYDNWMVFEKCTRAFNSKPVDFTLMQHISIPDIFYSLSLMYKIRKGDLSDEVNAYIYTHMKYNGVFYLPPIAADFDPFQKIYDLIIVKDASESGIASKQRSAYDRYFETGEFSPLIIEILRAINYKKVMDLSKIKQEHLYLAA